MPDSILVCHTRQDSAWSVKLAERLRELGRGRPFQPLRVRHDGFLGKAGADAISGAMAEARVVVLLVSAAFLNSRFLSGGSFRELLERSKSHGLRILPVLISPCNWQGSALASFQIRDARGRAFSALSPDEMDEEMVSLAREILELVSSPASPVSATAWRASSTEASIPRPYQLPSPPADFTGRGAELAALRRLLAAAGDSALIAGIFGTGGIGKTTLALKLAEEIAPRFPDGQIFLDMQGVTAPLSPAQAMAHVVCSFLPEARLPPETTALAALYRSVLHGKRALLFLDNAAGQGQVEPLLPPRGCAFLVTSRFRFMLPGLAACDLDEMTSAESRELLLRISPRIGGAAADFARLCGGLPLALRLAGSGLAERPDLDPGAYAKRLAEGIESLGPVDAALGTSYDLLAVDLRRLWPLLAVFADTFDGAAASAVWQLQDRKAADDLGQLVTSSLVDWEEGISRYRFPEHARSFADRQVPEDEREAAHGRHASHYLEVLRRAESLFQEGGERSRAGLGLFDTEWSNIRAGQAWAAGRQAENAEAMALCDDYPIVGRYCLDLRLPARERIRWREAALAASRHRKDRAHEAAHLGALGNAYADLEDIHRAIEFHTENLGIAREVGDRRGEGAALGNLANDYVLLGEIRRAIEIYGQVLAINLETGDRRGQAKTCGNLGVAYFNLGGTERAIEYLEQDLTLVRQTGDRLGEGTTLGNLGLCHLERGDTARAIDLFEQHLAIAQELGDRQAETNALGNLGNAHAARGDEARARQLFERQLAIVREVGDLWGEGRASWNLGLLFERDDPARAAKLMQVLVDVERAMGRASEEHEFRLSAVRSRLGGALTGTAPQASGALNTAALLLLAYRLVAGRHASPDLLLHFDAGHLREAAESLLAAKRPQAVLAQDRLAAAAALLAEELADATPDHLWVSWMMRTQGKALQHLTESSAQPPASTPLP